MKKVAVVTGANQGLGFAFIETLCKEIGDEYDVYLTARDEEKGQKALKELEEKGYHPLFYKLDVTDEKNVEEFAHFLDEKYGGVDIFISSAAARITQDIPQSKQVREFINTNNHSSAYSIIKHISPLLREGSRFFVVASSFGSLTQISSDLHKEFDVQNATLEDIENVMDRYVDLMESDKAKENGWPEWINIPSKIAQVASIKILANAKKQEAKEKNIMICAICPGLVDTDASRPWFDDMSFAKSPLEAAVDVIWLATNPEFSEKYYGELVQYRKVVPWKLA